MKKIVILIYVVMVMLASAQRDTLDNNLKPNYLRNCMNWTYDDWYNHIGGYYEGNDWWESHCFPYHSFRVVLGPSHSGVYDHGVEYHTVRPVRIIGAAAVATMQHWADTATSFFLG